MNTIPQTGTKISSNLNTVQVQNEPIELQIESKIEVSDEKSKNSSIKTSKQEISLNPSQINSVSSIESQKSTGPTKDNVFNWVSNNMVGNEYTWTNDGSDFSLNGISEKPDDFLKNNTSNHLNNFSGPCWTPFIMGALANSSNTDELFQHCDTKNYNASARLEGIGMNYVFPSILINDSTDYEPPSSNCCSCIFGSSDGNGKNIQKGDLIIITDKDDRNAIHVMMATGEIDETSGSPEVINFWPADQSNTTVKTNGMMQESDIQCEITTLEDVVRVAQDYDKRSAKANHTDPKLSDNKIKVVFGTPFWADNN